MASSSEIPDRKTKKRKEEELDWPMEVNILRTALREMDEQEEAMERGMPHGTSMEKRHERKRDWHRRKTSYLNMIEQALARSHKSTIPNHNGKEKIAGISPACTVSHTWGAHKQRKAAHIMPFRLRQLPLVHIFGKDYFDNCQLAIVPCLSEEDAWELSVMDKHLLNKCHHYSQTLFRDLHGRKLAFRNANRPRRRYLYYHWLVCINIAARKKINLQRIEEQKLRFSKYWGTPGKYLREEMIAAMMAYVGYEGFSGDNENASEDEEEEEGDEEERVLRKKK
ncbi:a540419a-50b7-46d0-9552-8dc78c9c4c09-CDS [Sclerotinia trifoliorum]|uniref:A540419a-50b7-46d0-9552-8dc78c9c4c09-CDS n=1 Tax=Sclerotinia trifoliorum TaxID=28548 RepID=A0A8H2VTQ7_9HELO|nr:a540419a-50b7-46d0-9552-8dc78c9c4c09-CDS [Sclerotinia trifoliorum]